MAVFKFKEYIPSTDSESAESYWKKLSGNKIYRFLFGAILGAAAGFIYWKFVGCTGGTCAITSDPYKSVILFSLMGGVLTRNK